MALSSHTLTSGGVGLALGPTGCHVLTPGAPGPLSFTATAVDKSGLEATAEATVEVVDCSEASAPTATLHAPAPGAEVTAPVAVVASAGDDTPDLLSWTVELIPAGATTGRRLAEGEGPIDEAEVATLDPTLVANGSYELRVTATDGIQAASASAPIVIGGDLKLGNFRIAFEDLRLPVAGIPIVVQRAYDTLDTRAGDFGVGWTFSLGARVDEVVPPSDDPLEALFDAPFTSDTRVYVTRPDGERVGFTFAPKPGGGLFFPGQVPAFEPDPGVTDTLQPLDGASRVMPLNGGWYNFVVPYNPDLYRLTTAGGIEYTIRASGGLEAASDAAGNTLTVTRDGVISSLGISLTWDRDAEGRITAIHEPAPSTGKHTYHYDTHGNLVGVRDQLDNLTTHRYEHAAFPHYLTAIEDPLGRPTVRTVYGDDGRMLATCGAEGDVVTLEGCQTFDYDVSGGQVTTYDPRGYRTDRFLDERGLVLVERRWLDGEQYEDTLFEYDEDGNLLSRTDPAGNTRTWTYDAAGNALTETDPAGRTEIRTYNACGRLAQRCDPLGNCISAVYDDGCRATEVTSSLGAPIIAATWTQFGASTLTTESGSSWTWSYDAQGNMEARSSPGGEVTAYTWDVTGRPTARMAADGSARTFVRDAAHRVIEERWNTDPEATIAWTYDAAGQVLSASAPEASITSTWSAAGTLASTTVAYESGPTVTLTYEYDGAGNVTKVTDSLGGTTTYGWDHRGRLVSIVQTGGGVSPKRVEREWDAAGLARKQRFYAGAEGVVETTYDYDCADCSTDATLIDHRWMSDGAPIHTLSWTRDEAGRISSATDAEGTHSYLHDARGRLLSADHPAPYVDESYGYSPGDNRTSSHLSASYVYATGDGHQLVEDDDRTYMYDPAGRVTKMVEKGSGRVTILGYDLSDQLVSILVTDFAGTVFEGSYAYDALGRRVRATENGQTRWYVYDGQNPVLVVDAAGTVLRRRLHGRHIDDVLAEEVGGEVRWLLTDQVGTVRDVVTGSGVVAHYVWDSFGRRLSGDGTVTELGYTGREALGDTGLWYYRARVYDPLTGRFLQRDRRQPWDYVYVDASPLHLIDPDGQQSLLQSIIVGGIVATIGAAVILTLEPQFIENLINEAVQSIVDSAMEDL